MNTIIFVTLDALIFIGVVLWLVVDHIDRTPRSRHDRA